MSIAIIPARGGSRRIRGKNIRMFHQRPIIGYSIETAFASGLFREVWVSTDDAEIANVAEKEGASVLARESALAVDEVGTQEVTRAALLELNVTEGLACCIYATAPMMLPEDLRRGLQLLLSSRSLAYAFSVGTGPLCDAGQFYWGHVRSFLDRVPLVDQYSAMVPIDSARVCDINTEDDWRAAERMFAELHQEAA